MGFNKDIFIHEKFIPREEEIPVPDLKDFFDEGESPVWKVRGLTGVEVARSNEAMERNKNIGAILEGLIARDQREKVESVKKLIGIDEKVPNDIAKRIELLILGSIEPKIDTQIAVKLCKVFPVEFYEITNKITLLTGRGHVPGKQKASGEIPKSS